MKYAVATLIGLLIIATVFTTLLVTWYNLIKGW